MVRIIACTVAIAAVAVLGVGCGSEPAATESAGATASTPTTSTPRTTPTHGRQMRTPSHRPTPSAVPPGDVLDPGDGTQLLLTWVLPDRSRVLGALVYATGELRRMATLQKEVAPVVDPTGRYVALVAAEHTPVSYQGDSYPSHSHLVLLDLATGDRTSLTPPPTRWSDWKPDWSADGSLVYFVRYRSDSKHRLMAVDPTTGAVSEVAGAEQVMSYALEPDGRHAWVSFSAAGGQPAGYRRLDLQTGSLRRYSGHREFPAASDVELSEPAWSPDGLALAWAFSGGDQSGVLSTQTLNQVRSRLRYVGPPRSTAWQARWLPSGRQVLVVVGQDYRSSAILLVTPGAKATAVPLPEGVAPLSLDVWLPTS